MNIVISNNANKPIYEQITSQIKTMIMRGELRAGEMLPSMRALANRIHVSVITVQKAYEDLQRDGFIETTVGRGSFVSARNPEIYQEEQQCRAEEHLQAAAEIGRESNIPLEKLTELLTLFYEEDERRIVMRELLLKKETVDGTKSISAVEASDGSVVYALRKRKDSMLAESFVVQSKYGEDVAEVKVEHVLFTPGKMPKATVSAKNGRRFVVKRELERLEDVINVEGEELAIKGTLFSEHFELLCQDRSIAAFSYKEGEKRVSADENYELMAVLFAFALELVR